MVARWVQISNLHKYIPTHVFILMVCEKHEDQGFFTNLQCSYKFAMRHKWQQFNDLVVKIVTQR
jgi:hypothetical protein